MGFLPFGLSYQKRFKTQVGFDPFFDPLPKDREAKRINGLRGGSKTNVI